MNKRFSFFKKRWGREKGNVLVFIADWLAQLVEHRATVREVASTNPGSLYNCLSNLQMGKLSNLLT